MLKKLLSIYFGFRWSLYVLKNKQELGFVMHSQNVADLIGYIGKWFDSYGDPKNNYSFALNFNKTNEVIYLTKELFKAEGYPTDDLWNYIHSIDKDWSGKPHKKMADYYFINVVTKEKASSREIKEIIY